MNDLTLNTKYKPNQKLYTRLEDLKQQNIQRDLHTENMISIIQKDTLPIEFKASWKENPDYKLENFNIKGQSGLSKAVRENNLEMTIFFIKNLKKGEIDDICTEHGCNQTPLLQAVLRRNIIIFRKNQATNFNNDEKALSNNFEIIEQLLIAGAEVNFADKKNDRIENLLSFALSWKDIALTKLFLLYGAQKLHSLSPDGKSIVKQKFTEEENKIYKQAKKELNIDGKKKKRLFLLGSQDKNSYIFLLPKEILEKIVTQDHTIEIKKISSNQPRINEVKKLITLNKEKNEPFKEESIIQIPTEDLEHDHGSNYGCILM